MWSVAHFLSGRNYVYTTGTSECAGVLWDFVRSRLYTSEL